jgi:hypothetical protein
MNLLDFLKKTLNERQAHINLSDPCVLHPIGGRVLKMAPLRQQHMDNHGITLEKDLGNLSSHCHVCHLCPNPECRNYYHTYLGTPSENFSDRILEGSYRGIGESYNNGYFEIKITEKDQIPTGYTKGRLPATSKKVSTTRKQNGIKNATNGVINIQVKTALGEVLPEGFEWGYLVTRSELTCPHCNKVGKGPNMKRYHFDNCKHRVKPNTGGNRYDD